MPDDSFLAALPFAAWMATDATGDRLRCNPQAAAMLGTKGGATATWADLEALFRGSDGVAGEWRRLAAAAFAGAVPPPFAAHVAQAADQVFDIHMRAVGELPPAAVLLLAIPRAGGAAAVPGDWWRRVGHDLRGPLTPVRMALQLLKSGRVKPENVAQTATLADRQLDQLLAVVDDVAGLLGVSAHAFVLQRAAVDLRASLDELSASGLQAPGGAVVGLECNLPAGPVMVTGDPVRLRQLLEHVIRRVATQAQGAALRVQLDAPAGRAVVRIGVPGLVPGDDAGLAYVAGALQASARVDMRSLLMREVARGHALTFEWPATVGELCLSLPLASPAASADA
jgi:signal transduction histidine kinase